jgi:uncharacterized protein YkwD
MTGVVVFLGVALYARATDWHKYSPDEFAAQPAAQPAAQARLDPAQFDRALMVAAIFHETNRVRRQLGLPAFTHLSKLDEAADLKASVGVLEPELRHESALPFTATPAKRVESVGLRYSLVAENIARLSSYDLPAGTSTLGVRRRNGLDEFYRLDTGRSPELQSYAGFAAVVVASWMKSPGHRANVVNPHLVSLGCAARPCRSPISSHEQLYAVQVFFAPVH